MLLNLFLFLASFFILWQFLGYPLAMGMVTMKSKQVSPDKDYMPFVSIIVPTYNEESNIKKKLENLSILDYHKDNYEVIVVDSGSTDNTAKIVRDVIDQHTLPNLFIKLVQEPARNGKASAINLGQKNAKGDLILITDANSFFDKSALKKLMPHFKDPLIGAVSGKYVVSNPDKSITCSESFYWEIESITFLGESFLDSISTVVGTISVWRKELLNFSSDTLAEDLDMTIQVRRKGYKIIYEPNALVYEAAATTAEDQIKQRKRISIGTIQNIFRHSTYFLTSPNLYSFLIFPSHKILPMLSPFILISIFLLYFLINDLNTILFHFAFISFSSLLLLICLIFVKSKIMTNGKSSNMVFSSKYIFNIFCYILLNEYLILRAWKDFSLRNYSILWDKAISTR